MSVRGQSSRKLSAEEAAEIADIWSAMWTQSWTQSVDGWSSAGEIASSLRGLTRTAQQMGSRLAMWERRGYVESQPEDWGKMWRPCAAACELVGALRLGDAQ